MYLYMHIVTADIRPLWYPRSEFGAMSETELFDPEVPAPAAFEGKGGAATKQHWEVGFRA